MITVFTTDLLTFLRTHRGGMHVLTPEYEVSIGLAVRMTGFGARDLELNPMTSIPHGNSSM